MNRFPLALASGALFALILTQAAPSAASIADTCSFERHIGYWTTFQPPNPCPGQPVSLVVHDCADCDHVISGTAGEGVVYLNFISRAICPLTLVCRPESLVVPLGAFDPGEHTIAIDAHAFVITGIDSGGVDTTGCDVYQHDSVTLAIPDSCGPPPPPPPGGPLPFVTSLTIGPTPPHSDICPGDSIRVAIHFAFPSLCFQLAGVELATPPMPFHPPLVRIAIDACVRPGCGCALVTHEADAVVTLPGMMLGSYSLPVEEVWVDHFSPPQIDSTFMAWIPFTVVDACSSSFACFLTSWEHQPGGCDAFVDRGHPAQAQMTVLTTRPLAGLQGELALYPPGLTITHLDPIGPASTWKVAWQPAPGGLVKYVMFSPDGTLIPTSQDSTGADAVLRVTVAVAGDTLPAPVTWLISGAELASDAQGNSVPPCPVERFAAPSARICFGSQACDLNRDGSEDVRDLVLMVNCVFGLGFCPDSSLAALDCNQDGRKTIDDVLCCAMEVLRGRMPDSTTRRVEPAVQVSFGSPVRTASGVDVPMHLGGAYRVGAARLALKFPSDRFRFRSLESAAGDWLTLGEADGSDLTLGMIHLGPAPGVGTPTTGIDLTLHLDAIGTPGGELRLASGDFAGPDGVALDVGLAPAVVPMDGRPRVVLAAPQPNPFAGETRFSVTLPPRTPTIEVTIHDIAGRRIATVVKDGLVYIPEKTGSFTVPLRWAGTDDSGRRVRDGIYFVHVRAAGTEVTRKVILLRGN